MLVPMAMPKLKIPEKMDMDTEVASKGDLLMISAWSDTLNAVILSCLDYTIGPNFENLPLLFPVGQLQQAGVLPDSVTDAQAAAFYGCLAGKIKTIYGTPGNFTSALFNDMDVPMELSGAMQACVTSVMGGDSTAVAQPNPAMKKK